MSEKKLYSDMVKIPTYSVKITFIHDTLKSDIKYVIYADNDSIFKKYRSSIFYIKRAIHVCLDINGQPMIDTIQIKSGTESQEIKDAHSLDTLTQISELPPSIFQMSPIYEIRIMEKTIIKDYTENQSQYIKYIYINNHLDKYGDYYESVYYCEVSQEILDIFTKIITISDNYHLDKSVRMKTSNGQYIEEKIQMPSGTFIRHIPKNLLELTLVFESYID